MANFNDTFTDADGTHLESHVPTVGLNWVKSGGYTTQHIYSNKVIPYDGAVAAGPGKYYCRTAGPVSSWADASVEAVFSAGANNGGEEDGFELFARGVSGYVLTYYYSQGGGNPTLVLSSGGIPLWTENPAPAITAAVTYKLTCVGTTITVHRNGSLLTTQVDATYASGVCGFYINSSKATIPGDLLTMDSFTLVDLLTPPTAPSLLAASCSLPAVTVASFTTDVATGDAPLTVNFTDTSSYNPTAWLWRFGDGDTSTDQNPSHVFATPGIYEIKLTATNTQGSSSRTLKLVVTDPAAPSLDLTMPVAMFSVDSALILPGASATVTDQSTGDVSSWAWTFGDGTTSAIQSPPAHAYANAGQYIITLTVTDARGLQSSTSQVIVVSSDVNPSDNVPTATIDPNYETVDAPGTVLFIAHVSTPDVFYLWDFGDGTTSTADASVNPISHEFISEGTYTVTLTVTNVYGSSTSSMQIVVRGFLSLGVSNTKYYVLDKQNDRVIVYGPTRAFVKTFGSRGSTAGKLKDPTQLLVSRAFMEVE